MFIMSTQTTHHRNVARRSDICIVGNGAIAKTAALGLSQAGHSVTLLVPPARP
jgi:thioredoxin reductase